MRRCCSEQVQYIGALPLQCALPKTAGSCANESGAQYFIRVCLGKPVSGATILNDLTYNGFSLLYPKNHSPHVPSQKFHSPAVL